MTISGFLQLPFRFGGLGIATTVAHSDIFTASLPGSLAGPGVATTAAHSDVLTAGNVGLYKIAESVLSGTAATVTFSSIPATYRNLILFWKGRGSDAAAAVDLRGRINNDSGVVYSNQNTTVDGASVTGTNASTTSFKVGSLVAAGSSTSAGNGGVIEIPGYSDSSLGGVPILTRCAYSQVASPTVTAKSEYDTCLYVAAAPVPVTRVDLFPASSLFTIGCSFQLYGAM